MKAKRLVDMELWELLELLESKFKVKKLKPKELQTYMFSLVCWENGYWNIEITDDWHKWIDKSLSLPPYLYVTPRYAVIKALEYIKKHRINIKKLQS